jgi:hypothetical protein
LLLVAAVISAAIALFFLAQLRRVFKTDRLIIMMAAASVPFVFVRMVYVMLLAFDNDSKFNPRAPNVYVEAFMQVLMEFIIVAMYLVAGLFSAKIGPDDHTRGRGMQLSLPGKGQGAYDRSGAPLRQKVMQRYSRREQPQQTQQV